MRVERLYRCMKIFNIIYMNWLKLMVVPTLSSSFVAITVALYVTCRPAAMPLVIYFGFPVAAVVLLFIIFQSCYEAVVAKRAGDEVLEHLQSQTVGYMSGLDQAEKREMVRRARALRPVYLALGEFAEVTLEVSVSIWEEIINQLLFLLSL